MTDDMTVTIETPTEREVVVTRLFKAARQAVFDAFTKPELIRRWYSSGVMERCESEPTVGGTWRFVMTRNGKTVGQYGIYTEVTAPDHFVRTERWDDWDPGETLVKVDLAGRGGTTTMTMTLVFPSKDVRDVVMKGGLTPKSTSEFFERLDAVLAS